MLSRLLRQSDGPLILLISGWAGSGKDAAAALLAEELAFDRFSFAGALKTAASAETGIPVADFHNHLAKDAPLPAPCPMIPDAKTPREVLLAIAARERARDPDVYAKAIAGDIVASEAGRVVVSDWRLLREREYFAKHFPHARILTMRISRSSVKPRPEAIEHELDEYPFNLQIANDGCISDLRDALRHSLRPHLG